MTLENKLFILPLVCMSVWKLMFVCVQVSTHMPVIFLKLYNTTWLCCVLSWQSVQVFVFQLDIPVGRLLLGFHPLHQEIFGKLCTTTLRPILTRRTALLVIQTHEMTPFYSLSGCKVVASSDCSLSRSPTLLCFKHETNLSLTVMKLFLLPKHNQILIIWVVD